MNPTYDVLNLSNWRTEQDPDGVLWVFIDKADDSANVLSANVLEELNRLLGQIELNRPSGVVFASGKPGMFIMGADINEFTQLQSPDEAVRLVRRGQRVIDRIESLSMPTAALIDGHALGGGLELALACDYRVAIDTDKPTIGLPEVRLGIHPGFGGTVRSIELAGVRAAMPLMLTGKSLRPAKALAIGLIDAVASRSPAKDKVRELLRTRAPRRRAGLVDRLLALWPIRGIVADRMEREVGRQARREHFPAPYAVVDLWRRHAAKGRAAYDAEAESIAELMCSDTSRNLVRVFFLQNNLKRQGGRAPREVERVHVVGAGVMGGDIAAWCAFQGLTVTLQDREEKYVTPAIERAHSYFERKLRGDAVEAAKQRLVADVAATTVSRRPIS